MVAEKEKNGKAFSVVALVMMVVGITTLIGSVIVWVAPYIGTISRLEGEFKGERAWVDKWLLERESRLLAIEEKIRFIRELHTKPHEHQNFVDSKKFDDD